MESHHQPPARVRNAKRKVRAQPPLAALPLPNLAELIKYGEITIGPLGRVGCVATAADEDCTYAMLVRRRGESLPQLLARLDQAVDKALTLGIFTDEINR